MTTYDLAHRIKDLLNDRLSSEIAINTLIDFIAEVATEEQLRDLINEHLAESFTVNHTILKFCSFHTHFVMPRPIVTLVDSKFADAFCMQPLVVVYTFGNVDRPGPFHIVPDDSRDPITAHHLVVVQHTIAHPHHGQVQQYDVYVTKADGNVQWDIETFVARLEGVGSRNYAFSNLQDEMIHLDTTKGDVWATLSDRNLDIIIGEII